MLLQKMRNPYSAIVLMTHAYRQRLHAAMEQETCMGVERTAEVSEFAIDTVDQIGAPNHCTSDDVGMSIEVLGATVQRKIEAHFGRAEIYRTRKSVIDNRNQSVSA